MPSDTEILAAVARALNGSIDVDEALEAVLTTVAEYLDLPTGWVWVADAGDRFRLGAARRLPEGLRRDPDWTSGGCWCQTRFCEGGLAGGDVELITCSRLDKLGTGTDGLRYHASLPLQAGDERLGLMNLASRDWRELTEDELRLLRAVSDMLAVALVRARLYERSAELGAIDERARLSREIHDGVAQTLTALVLRLEALRATSDGHGEEIDRALELARAGLDDTRRAVIGLRSSPFGDDLKAGVDRVLRDVRVRSQLNVELTAPIDGEPPLRVIHATCRILQEALTNVARHSGVDSCEVRLRASPHSVVLEVRDAGYGFTPSTADGFGLPGMRERAHLLGGVLDVEPDDDGTVIRFRWSER